MPSKNRFPRISPAMIVACAALFCALTGSALAAGLAKNSVHSAQIANGAVRTVDLHRDAVKAAKIAPNAVAAEEIAPDAVGGEELAPAAVDTENLVGDAVRSAQVADQSLTSDDLGAGSVGGEEVVDDSLTASDLAADAVHASELGRVGVRTNSATVEAGQVRGISVPCNADEQMLGGGAQPNNLKVELIASFPQGNGWAYQARNNDTVPAKITVFAICLEA